MCDQQPDVATVEAEPKSLTNIYYDCLERIFDFLDLESLMNVAGTCKRLQIAAAAKYAEDYGNADVWLFGENYILYAYRTMETIINVHGLKFCLTFLRCFGAKISSLYIEYEDLISDALIEHLDRYINQYCADTLNTIYFMDARSFSSEIFTRPFKAVEKLSLCEIGLSDQLPNFVHYFPNLQHLSFIGSISTDDNAIAASFPHLKHLHIAILEYGSGLCSTENVIKFLHANQQLQSLELYMTAKFEKLLDVISANKSILILNVHGRITDVGDVQLNRLANEHPLLEELEFFWFEVDDAIALIRQFPSSLKRFKFRVSDQTECDRFLNQLDTKWKQEIRPRRDGISIIISRE